MHQADPTWLLIQTEQPERYIYEPKARNVNNDWIGDSIKESLLTLLSVKIQPMVMFHKKKVFIFSA